MQGVEADLVARPANDVDAPAPIGDLTVGEYDGGDVEVLFAASDTLYDGRFAKNVWLQELPQPMTKLVWDNAAIVSPQTAAKLGLSQGARTTTETVVLSKDGRRIELPVFIMPGQAPGAITVHLGYGRICRDEAVVSDEQVKVGVDPSPLRSADNSQILTGVQA